MVNNYPGVGIYTPQQLAQWVMADPTNLIGFVCNRNPTYAYEYLKRNYPAFGRMVNGAWATPDGIRMMYEFLVKTYNALPQNQRAHWIVTFAGEVPVVAELKNFTTPAGR